MPLTMRQKCLGGVMLLAGVAFAWDRATSGKPAAAAEGEPANAAAELLITPSTPASPGPRATESTPPAKRLGARIAEAAVAEQLDPLHADDAFLVPSAWPTHRAAVAAQAPATAPAKPTELEVDRALAEEFVKKHHLDAVMAKSSGGYAIINGQGVEVGRAYDHFRLVAVTSASATFQRGRVRVEIRLPTTSDVHLDGSTIESRSVADTQE